KHRIGLDNNETYSFVRDFVGIQQEAGCDIFIVHARNAVLKGLSPKENRNIPPLRYSVVHQLKRDFPQARYILNGGVSTTEAALDILGGSEAAPAPDGVMLGREAWHRPRVLSEISKKLWPQVALAEDAEVVARL